MEVDGARPIGRRLRQIRQTRRKSLHVVAGLAGTSSSHLHRIETGARPLDSLTLILALADALQVAPSDLMTLPVPAPGNGPTDGAINAVRLALLAVGHNRPDGQVQPVDAVRKRVTAVVDAYCRCDRNGVVGAALPGLIRDLHTSITAGRDVAELLDLAVLLHSHATVGWLRVVGGSLDLRSQAAELARHAATEWETPQALGLAAWGGMYVLVLAGAVDLAHAELADRTGEVNAYGLGFGPQEVGQWRARTAMEAADHERTTRVAEGLAVQTHPLRSRQATYWVTYGRALARLRERRDDAVRALRHAELILPHYVERDPLVRDVLAELLTHARRDAVGRELRGMAYRAGRPA